MKHPFPPKKVIKIYGMESRCLFKMAMYLTHTQQRRERQRAKARDVIPEGHPGFRQEARG